MAHNPSSDGVLYQMNRSDYVAFQYAWLHDFARATENEWWAESSRMLLFNHLQEYRRFLDGGTEPSKPMSAWTPFERTIRYASRRAGTYLGRMDHEAITEAIRMDMREEDVDLLHVSGQSLPHGVAEWIVYHVEESS